MNRDESEEDFYHYFRSMPWYAIPKEYIPDMLLNTADIFKLTGIPHLVLLNARDGTIITVDGREKIVNDKFGAEFPWRTRSLLNLVPSAMKQRFMKMLTHLKSELTRTLHPMNIIRCFRDVIVSATIVSLKILRSAYSYILNGNRNRHVEQNNEL